MSEQNIYKQIDEKYSSLPESIKQALDDSDHLEAVVDGLTSKYDLWSKDTGKLYDEMIAVIAGVTNPKDFIRRIASGLDLDNQKATAIAQEINAKVFQPIRDDIKTLSEGSPTPQKPPVSALHSTIDTSRMTEAAPAPELPKMHSVDADLLASVGVKKPLPPAPPVHARPPLDKELEENLVEKESAGVEFGKEEREEIPAPTPAPSEQAEHKGKELNKGPSFVESSEPRVVSEVEPPRQPSAGTPAGSFSFSKGFADGHQENENDLIREDILKAIENPDQLRHDLTAGIKDKLKPIRTMETDRQTAEQEKPLQAPMGTPPSQYEKDPYRESPN